MKLEEFDYILPRELIAQHPLERREDSRLLVLDRAKNELRETRFFNFPRYLREGDLLVVNETKVIPARIFGKKSTGATVEVFLTRRLEKKKWIAMVRPSKRVRENTFLYIGKEQYPLEITERLSEGRWIVTLPESIDEGEFLENFGHVPLPPYIKRADGEIDRERYQTIFARHEGSVAAPTAGLHFTDEILRRITSKGVTVVPISLHVGPGTFKPLKEEVVENNRLEPEFLMVRLDRWEEILYAIKSRRRIIAVGTTSTRALEALALDRIDERRIVKLEDGEYITGWTDLFIYPGFKFKVVDALVTNLHLPRSSLILLVSAFAGRERVLRAYEFAVSRRFRFYSYGDVMFIR